MTALARRRVALRLAAGRAVARFVVAAVVYGLAAGAYRAVSGSTGQPPFAGVVGVTVVVAALLWLLCDRIDRLAARLLLGEQADGYEVMRVLTRQLAGTLPVDEVAPRVAEAASHTTRQSRAEVRLWLADGQRWSRSWPPATATVGHGTTVQVRHTGSSVGEIAVEDGAEPEGLSPRDRRLLEDLARPAGPALSTVRLTVDLRRRKADLERLTAALEASRQRLLRARILEQHRMHAEVAARVSPHIATALAALGEGRQARLNTGAFETAGLAAGQALDELRSIARGVFPPTLFEVGLAASLESWLIRAHVDAELEVPDELPALHACQDLEACLYFCTVTSLAQLAGRGASRIKVAVTDQPGPRLRIEAGLLEAAAPEVVEAMRDRIEAFSGTVLSVVSTGRLTLTAEVPVAAGGPS
ncbi:MAG: hypothetical protein L0H79_12810 [Intrasporangium sp.]|uniref:hypothetical protein n=1 Tax=Intrasporangium sp. TaxID=1925024 RepID=UPI0026473F2A|nr:hypothetical protein [Intrasporangium sp.]MDN5796621.1 hypothetical protein [Intrasporangium sp.]